MSVQDTFSIKKQMFRSMSGGLRGRSVVKSIRFISNIRQIQFVHLSSEKDSRGMNSTSAAHSKKEDEKIDVVHVPQVIHVSFLSFF